MLIQNNGDILEATFNGQGQVIGIGISEVENTLGTYLTVKYSQIVEAIAQDKELKEILDDKEEVVVEKPVEKEVKKSVKKLISKVLKKSKK